LKDLIDDNPIEDESDSESDGDVAGVKRKRDDDDELDDQLSEEDLALLEENTGFKFKV
jgi:Acidic N-terminal SPT6